MAEDSSNAPAPIIIKKKKGGGHGHHGGAWKVAYADFVTAMMAFFLLLWLLNATTEEQKKGIAEYFSPTAVSNSNSGANGVLGGKTLAPGPLANQSGGMTVGIPITSSANEVEEATDKSDNKTPPEDAENPEEAKKLTEEQFKKEQIRREDESFAKAENDLRQAIQDVPELRQLAQNLIIDRTPEGMRIQIVDQDKYSMFPLGSSALYEHTTKLMAMVVRVVERMPNKVSVTGHTDATPYGGRTNYTNWELSTDRANASRRAMMDSGLDPKRLARVVGKADQEPLLADSPADPHNRRISIVLLRESQLAGTGG
jgi:chemotaxis protein MotB